MRTLNWLLVGAALATASPAAAQPGRTAIAHPTGASDVVLRVSSGGGFVPAEFILGALPAFTLYGDGRLIVPGAVPQIAPGPAISPLRVTTLKERQVQELLRRATRAGLLAPHAIDYGDMGAVGVSDMPTTTLVVRANGRRVTREVYALEASTGGGRLSVEQTNARHALARFIDGLPHGLTGARYVPHGIAAYVTPFSGQAQPGAGPVTWPLTSDLGAAGTPLPSGLHYRCITVRGKDTQTLLARLRAANAQTRWTMRGDTRAFALIARPLLPDERDCSSLFR